MSFLSFFLWSVFLGCSSGYFLYHGLYGLRGLERCEKLKIQEKNQKYQCYNLFKEHEFLTTRIENFREPFVQKDVLELYSWTLFRLVPQDKKVILLSPQ